MAEDIEKTKQYQYTANSNLVLQADRNSLPRRDQEPSGEPETLFGRINPKDFGARALRDTTQLIIDKEKKKKRDQEDDIVKLERQRRKKQDKALAGGYGYSSILAATEDFEGLSYRPRTKETRSTYELILSFVHELLGDQTQDVIRSATDTVLRTLKDENLKDFDKKREIESIVGPVPSEKFAQAVNLSKKLTDYHPTDAADGDEERDEKAEDTLDDQLGVAVLFDEEEEEDVDVFEVRDESDDDEDNEDINDTVAEQAESIKPDVVMSNANEEDGTVFVIGGSSTADGAGKPKTKQMAAAGGLLKDKLTPHDIDAFWLQRVISFYYPDPHTAGEKTAATLKLLGETETIDTRDCENELMSLYDYDKFDLVKVLTRNRDLIFWSTRLVRAGPDQRPAIEEEMKEKGTDWILMELAGERTRRGEGRARKGVVEGAMEIDEQPVTKGITAAPVPAVLPTKGAVTETGAKSAPRAVLDLDALSFSEGGHLMSNKKCKLPEGSFKRSEKGYEEIHIPAPKARPFAVGEKLISITDLPKWAGEAFKGAKQLNRVQSQLYPAAFGSDGNVLLCAPTGAGKTNVAMLCILREVEKMRDPETGVIDLDNFKIVYIAPMKALVQEMVGNFGSRLATYGIKVNELTGDRQLTKEQIAETQIIVTTPEKWDVITRKATDRSYTSLVRLIIIDEIHLLHDDRGPVLESIVSRTIRNMEQTQEAVRLVGLSATLPNYADVATFLRVDPKKGLFHFDSTYRPCPLKQEFIGVTEKKAIKRFQVMNEVCYNKVMDQAGKNQVLVFVHSRKETAKTAKALRDMALEKDTIGQFLQADSASREILQTEASTCKDANLQDLLPYGFACHHAGMTRADRTLVEELFADGHVQVLVSTATLAWGVNLPAHSVIIKGTQVYSPEKGRWVELSPQDVLQMLGRAGRPQFDTFGEGIIITSHQELQYYLSLLNTQLPIESQFVSRLADNLNAEIVLGNIRSRDEAVQWLGYTYLYVRMLRNPSLYGVSADDITEDAYLEQKRVDLVHSAATLLDRCGLMKYDRKTGRMQGTELGRIASHYYITHHSMATYHQHLRPHMGFIELFRIFALSDEFKYIPVREEEKLELSKLLERVPVPVKEGVEEPTAKINVLLQSYISQLKLEGFALVSDMVYVTQSAGRILRAIFEICLKRGWALLARRALDVCKMVEKRMWPSMTPLRQFKTIPSDLIRRLERKEYPWDRLFDLNPQEIGELIGVPKAGRLLHKHVHQFPKLDLVAHVQPVTRSMLRIELTVTPDFQWDEKVHGTAQAFWLIVEDVDGEQVLFHDSFILKQRYCEEEHTITFTVPLFDPVPPNYYVSLISDRWMACETRLPISFKHLLLPEKYPPHTDILDLQPLPVAALRDREFESIYNGWVQKFNPIQTQVFPSLFNMDHNVFVGAATASGKTICAEFALLRMWTKTPPGERSPRCVFIAPFQEVADHRARDWQKKFGQIRGGKTVVSLTGETTADLKILERGDVIVATPEQWDVLSRRWKKRKNVQTVGLFIADELHLIGGEIGPTYEVIVSRMRYIASQTEGKTRIVALSASLANAGDIGEWIGAPQQHIFNFHPMVRPVPLEIHIQGYSIPHHPSLMIAMGKPAYTAIETHSPDKPVIAFVPNRKQCRLTAVDILTYAAAEDRANRFLGCKLEAIQGHLDRVQDKTLKEMLTQGVGFYHEALNATDRAVVEQLFESGAIQVVVANRDTCWSIPMSAHMVLVMGTQYFEGKEHRYVDYPITDVLQMLGRACRPQKDETGRCILMCQSIKKEFYRKFLFEALPVESHLDHYLHDHFNAEIGTKTIENKQDAVDYLTWTFLYRRMAQNPNYYNLQGSTHRHLSEHLSELVETTLSDLQASKCITVEDEMDVAPLNLGMIAAYYNIHYATVEMFGMSLTSTTKLRGLLEIVSAATEFENVPIRRHEDVLLKRLQDRLPVKAGTGKLNSPHTKTNLILQSHFSRFALPPDLQSDQHLILGRVIPLLQAAVDVISSNGWLSPALAVMELSQMCVQGLWDRDSPLRQIPYFTTEVVDRCLEQGIDSVFGVQEMEDDERNKLLSFDAAQMQEVAKFVNRYPSIEVSFEIVNEKTLQAGSPVVVRVSLEREGQEDDDEDEDMEKSNEANETKIKKKEEEVGPVIAPYFPVKKDEGWWIIVGDPKTKALLVIKRVTLERRLNIKLEFVAPKAGEHEYRLYLMADSYLGVDQEFEMPVVVAEGEDSSESEEDEDEDTEMQE